MKISYGITVCDEFEEIKRLLSILLLEKRNEDEIVVLVDKSNTTDEVVKYLSSLQDKEAIKLHLHFFNKNFADWKNLLTSLCSGDYIFQIDADETPALSLITSLPAIINNNVDVILVPRVNRVTGLTEEYIKLWNWSIDSFDRINWPDYQWRIYKNVPNLVWINKVHERLSGFRQYATLPADEFFALSHIKNIDKQEKQNNFYNTL